MAYREAVTCLETNPESSPVQYFTGLREYKRLEALRIRTPISYESVSVLRETFKALTSLTHLEFGVGILNDIVLLGLLPGIVKLTNLAHLSLGNFSMSRGTLTSLRLTLGACPQLRSLDLSFLEITEDKIAEVFRLFSEHPHLIELRLNGISLSQGVLELFLNGLKSLTHLEVLSLRQLRFDSKESKAAFVKFEFLSSLPNLRCLDIGMNFLSGTDDILHLVGILSHPKIVPNLVELTIELNQLRSEEMKTLNLAAESRPALVIYA